MSNSHDLAHSLIACKSYCNRLASCKLLTTLYNVNSSAYVKIFEYLKTLQISFICNRKKGGKHTALWHRTITIMYI